MGPVSPDSHVAASIILRADLARPLRRGSIQIALRNRSAAQRGTVPSTNVLLRVVSPDRLHSFGPKRCTDDEPSVRGVDPLTGDSHSLAGTTCSVRRGCGATVHTLRSSAGPHNIKAPMFPIDMFNVRKSARRTCMEENLKTHAPRR